MQNEKKNINGLVYQRANWSEWPRTIERKKKTELFESFPHHFFVPFSQKKLKTQQLLLKLIEQAIFSPWKSQKYGILQ